MELADLPADTRALAEALADGLERTFGERFAGLFVYGAACFPPASVTDFDYHVLLTASLDDGDRTRLDALHAELESMPFGDDMDGWYVTVDDARAPEPPAHQRMTDRSDESWALHRAHVHADRYVCVRGVDPKTIVPEPTWAELDEALIDSELDFVTEHLDDAHAFAVLNLCRIWASFERRDVVMSKLDGAMWALAGLPTEWHALIRTALHNYDTHEFEALDVKPFYDEMVGRITAARQLVA